MSLNTIFDNGTHKMQSAGRLANESELAKMWRDSELKNTDWIVPVADHPQYAAYLVYRQALRDWPETEDFPTTRPAL